MTTCNACGAAIPSGARFCPACGVPLEPGLPMTEERKLATMVFADLVGSTALAASDDPERVRARLDRFYDAMAEEVALAGGTLEKFAGDAVVAHFGVPAALEDHAERALHSALAMQRRLSDLFGGELSLRIGVNTGEVVVGRPREGSSFVSGDAVNVAARLEQAAEPDEILAGQRTVAAVRGAFEFGEPRTAQAKGKPDGLWCRRVVRALTLMRPRGLLGAPAGFVGREPELELLRATYHRAVDLGEPHLVTIMGDAGVGKSRLVRELWSWLADQEPQPSQRTGRCLPYGQIAYWALGEVLREHLGLLETDAEQVVLTGLGKRPILALTLGVDVAGSLHPLAAREQLHDAWVDVLSELASERPVVLLVEDLHWAEEPLLELLERIARNVQGPLLLVGTARPELLERRPGWGGGRRNASLLWVEPLAVEHAVSMVRGLLAEGTADDLAAAIVERAEGNPFFVEELVGSLLDQGVLERRGGRLAVRAGEGAVVTPDSVHAVLAARIDRLPPADKAALQAAAVIGRVFWEGPVVALVGGEPPDFALLEDRDFIRRRAGSSVAGEREYAIKHALTREVAYESLPKARRAHLHAAFADWLEGSSGGRDEVAPLLAHHLSAAVRPEDADLAWADANELDHLRSRAVTWLSRAGELAVGRYEIDEGLAFLHSAVALTDDVVVRSALLRQIGLANALKFDGVAFRDAMERSLEICPDRATCAETYSLLAYHTAMRSSMWRIRLDRTEIQGWAERALDLAGKESSTRARALIVRCIATDPADPAVAAEASAMAERLGDPELRSAAWFARAVAAFDAGLFHDALSFGERRFAATDEISDPDHHAELYGELSGLYAAAGRFHEARRSAERGDEISSRLTAHHRVHGVSYRIECDELLGDWERVAGLRERAEAAIEANIDTPCVRNMRTLLVCALAETLHGAERLGRALEERAEALGMTGYDRQLSAPRIRLALARADLGHVEELVCGRLSISGSWHSVAGTTTRLDALAALRDAERVEEHASLLSEPGTYFEPFTLRALGIVRGDETLVGLARERFEALGLSWHSAQTETLISLGR